MSNYVDVRKEAKRRGPFSPEASLPILIQPSKEFIVTRLITVPIINDDGKRAYGLYMQQPAIITVLAFSSGEASARADEIQYNTNNLLWGSGSKPWTSDGKTSWRLVELPPNTDPLVLR